MYENLKKMFLEMSNKDENYISLFDIDLLKEYAKKGLNSLGYNETNYLNNEKLIRDKYSKKIPDTLLRIANDDEKDSFLEMKLYEEISELKDSNFSDVNEFADVLEVLENLGHKHGISLEQMLKAKDVKRDKLGSFHKFLIYKMGK